MKAGVSTHAVTSGKLAFRAVPAFNKRRSATACNFQLPPSSRTAGSRLEKLQRHTVILSDQVVSPTKADQEVDVSSSAVVNFALLSHILANTSVLSEYANAIDKGAAFAHVSSGSEAAAMDHALVNIGLMLKDRVSGRIVTEVDPRLANDADALEKRARSLCALYTKQGCPLDKLLMLVPATWAGLEAVQRLEADGIQTQVSAIFSLAQGVAAVKAKASVIGINISRIDGWYKKNPGAIRNPAGPRQDAGTSTTVDVGTRLASAVYCFAQQRGGTSKVLATGVHNEAEAIALSGVDYMVLPAPIMEQLEQESTLQGYNNGLSATGPADDADGIPVLTPEAAQAWEFRPSEVGDLTEAGFDAEVGLAGRELLAHTLGGAEKSVGQVAGFLQKYAFSRE